MVHPCLGLHRMIFTAKYVRARLTNIRCFFVTYATQDGIWTASSHPLPPSPMEPGNVPYASRATSYPRQQHDTFAFLPLFSISTLIKISKKNNNDSSSLIRVSRLPITIYQQKKQKRFFVFVFPNTPTRILAPQSKPASLGYPPSVFNKNSTFKITTLLSKLYSHTHVHAYHEGSWFKNQSLVPWFAMGGTWDLDPDDFLLRVFFLDLFFYGDWSLWTGPPPSPRVDSLSASSCCCVNYT